MRPAIRKPTEGKWLDGNPTRNSTCQTDKSSPGGSRRKRNQRSLRNTRRSSRTWSIKRLNATVFQIRKFASHLSVSRSGDLNWPFRTRRLRLYQGASETQSSFCTHSQDPKMFPIHVSASLTNAHHVDCESCSIESSSRRLRPC